MEAVYFTLAAVLLYYVSDAVLDWMERLRGARFANRQLIFLAIILPLALASFTLIRVFTGG